MERIVGGVGVLDKAVAILDALEDGPQALTAIVHRTGIPRPTAHRLCAALEQHGLIVRNGDERQLGPRLRRWAGKTTSFEDQLISAAARSLKFLRDVTEESVQLYVKDGDQRRCIAGLESPHGLRTIVEVGARLPLDVGSAGAVFLEGPTGHRGCTQSVEEREKGVASVSAPVFLDGRLVAAISVSGPIERTSRQPVKRYGPAVVQAANQLQSALQASAKHVS